MKRRKKWIVILIMIICMLGITIGSALYINPHNIKVREEILVSNKIDDKLDGLLVLYFSDLHFGNNLNDEDIDLIENKINDFKPDIIIFGGDLLSNNCNNTARLVSFLNNIKAQSGKYAVLGDEDIDNEDGKRILENAEFRILNNKNEKIFINDSFINIIGIEPMIKGNPNIDKAYEGVDNGYFTFAITHCPDLADKLDKEKTDYILAGHSLGGPVYLPFINFFYRERGCQNYFKGKNLVNDIVLDISNGLGTIDKDIRLFSSPEIVFYKLSKK